MNVAGEFSNQLMNLEKTLENLGSKFLRDFQRKQNI